METLESLLYELVAGKDPRDDSPAIPVPQALEMDSEDAWTSFQELMVSAPEMLATTLH